MVVHSRGRLHITMRELRSMLGFLLFGDKTCEQIHTELESGTQTEERRQSRTNCCKARELAAREALLQQAFPHWSKWWPAL